MRSTNSRPFINLNSILFSGVVLVAMAAGTNTARDFEPIRFYDRNGIVKRQIKIWRDTFTVNTGNGYTVDITAAGFSSVRYAVASVLQNTTTTTDMATATAKSWTTSQVVVNISQPQTVALTLANVTAGLTVTPVQFITTPANVKICVLVAGE